MHLNNLSQSSQLPTLNPHPSHQSTTDPSQSLPESSFNTIFQGNSLGDISNSPFHQNLDLSTEENLLSRNKRSSFKPSKLI